jgi:primosomal protein N' (replication factor Y) (superfamily II helicase)
MLDTSGMRGNSNTIPVGDPMNDPTPRYASIALPVPNTDSFTYLIPPELAQAAEPGRRAVVPFGRRLLTGFIVETGDDPGDVPPEKCRPISDIPDDEPVFDDHMRDLARWISDYYLCAPGEVLRAMMPAGGETISRIRVYATDSPPKARGLTGNQRKALDIILGEGSMLLRTLDRTAGFKASSVVRALERKGLVRLEREVRTSVGRAKTVRMVRRTDIPALTIPSRARKQLEVATILDGYGETGITLTELLERYGVSRGVVNALTVSGHAEYEDVPVARLSRLLDQDPVEADHPLTSEQEQCMAAIREETALPSPRPMLIMGVTGSGKTRLYIEAVREAMAAGLGSIILVPEISLTPQTTRFFSSVFGDRVAVLHSAMSPGERHDMWHMVHSGERTVVIGPRSAVFAPVHDLGLIVVDEEHDGSYKQSDNAPRYHGRDVAVVRARMLGIPVLLGSATPSLESWRNADENKYIRCHLTERIAQRSLPEVVTVDMREERQAENMSSLSRLLRDELSTRRDRGEKAIILINRRGFARGVQCRECGEVLKCPYCAITLTYHRTKGLALCHMCGHDQRIMEHCPECGAADLYYRGAGTQRVEAELETIVGAGGIIRMDADTTRAHDAHFRLLEEFRTGDATVLLGTQMVAKGLDFPEVTLVGILSADSALYIPDFRAGERTFQLITQVAGRSGRGTVHGAVVLQTFTPDNYAIETAAAQDYQAFAELELVEREAVEFPPFSRLVLIEFSGADHATVTGTATECAAYLRKYASEGAEIMGPADAPVARVRGRHRVHILCRTAQITRLLGVVRHAVEVYQSGMVSVSADVDPVDLL